MQTILAARRLPGGSVDPPVAAVGIICELQILYFLSALPLEDARFVSVLKVKADDKSAPGNENGDCVHEPSGFFLKAS
jgi:hypothetical protein